MSVSHGVLFVWIALNPVAAGADEAPRPVPVSEAARPRPAAPARKLIGLWIGSTHRSHAIQIVVLTQSAAELTGLIEVQDVGGGFVSHPFTGRIDGIDVVLTSADRSLTAVLTLNGSKVSGRLESPGRPDVPVSLVRPPS